MPDAGAMKIKKVNLIALAISLALPNMSAFAEDAPQKKTTRLTAPLEVSISKRGPQGGDPIAIIGLMQIDIQPDGLFTGTVTRIKRDDGEMLPAVLFYGSSLTPDVTGPKELSVTGSVNGNQISFAFDFGLGEDGNHKAIAGIGVTL